MNRNHVWSQKATEEVIALLSRPIKSLEVIDEIKFCIEREGANPNSQNEDGITPLMYIGYLLSQPTAIQNIPPPHDVLLNTFAFFLSRPDIDMSIYDIWGRLLIHQVVLWENPNFLRILLDNISVRQNIDTPTLRMAFSPLHLACSFSHVPVENIQHLLDAGANSNLQCAEFGRTPLHWVLVCNNLPSNIHRAVQILEIFFHCRDVRIGDPNLKDKWGKTLLHYAAGYMRSKRIVDMLLKNGEFRSIDVLDSFNNTPIKQAHMNKNTEAIQAIQSYVLRQ
jgi:ankyrin repeat protein